MASVLSALLAEFTLLSNSKLYVLQDCEELYLEELKDGKVQPGHAGKTWPW